MLKYYQIPWESKNAESTRPLTFNELAPVGIRFPRAETKRVDAWDSKHWCVGCVAASLVLWCVVSAHMSAARCRVPMRCPTYASHTCADGVPLSRAVRLVALLPSAPMPDRMLGCYPPKGRRIRPTRLAGPTSGWGRGRVPMGGDPN